MKTFSRRTGFTLLTAALLGVSLAGCAGEPKENGVTAPVIAEVENLDGATFEITLESPLVVNAPDPVEWSGEVEDSAVAQFVPGRGDGSAVFNPGFEAVGAGSTGASLTGPDGDEFTFTIVVP